MAARAKSLSLDNPKHALKRTIESVSYRKRTWEVWSDFCELTAISLSNAVDVSNGREKREQRYHQIRQQYEPHEFEQFPVALACLVEAMEIEQFDDVLGAMFMELDLGSHWHGQFFTPYSVAKMMGRMTFDSQSLVEREFITLQEPACGAGGQIIAYADAMHEHEGCNPQQRLHVTAIDVDPLCVHMAYVQLSLLHIPAVVIHGNTLSLETWSRWYTPAHVLGLWSVKLKRGPRRVADAPCQRQGDDEGVSEAAVLMRGLVEDEPSAVILEDDSAEEETVTSARHEQLALF